MTTDFNLQAMSNRELFCTLTGDNGFVQQTYLRNIIRSYKAEHKGQCEKLTLSEMVNSYFAEHRS